MKKLFALVDAEACYDVAGFIALNVDKAPTEVYRAKWKEIADALYALSNDTDFIVTDASLVPEA